jgi:hypothetical protein
LTSTSIRRQVRKLDLPMRSILADLSLASSSRLSHVRSLWWRLVDNLDSNMSVKGGFLRVRFTYVTMIQVSSSGVLSITSSIP